MSNRHRKLSKHHFRRRTKRIFITLETVILIALVGVVCFCAGAGKNKFDALAGVLDEHRKHADSIVVKLDSLDAHVAALHEITETNRSRSKQIATGANIILRSRKDIDLKQAAYLASILYDESEFNSTVEYPFLLAIIESESQFNAHAVSPAGAVGLGQLMPNTAEAMARNAGMRFNKDLLTEPRYNIKLSVQYLSRLAKQFQSNVLIAAAYNGGPGGANKYRQWIEGETGKESVHAETVAYVETVMQRYYQYRSMLQ
jgi:soluble lytic murein transglycosylase-like protein